MHCRILPGNSLTPNWISSRAVVVTAVCRFFFHSQNRFQLWFTWLWPMLNVCWKFIQFTNEKNKIRWMFASSIKCVIRHGNSMHSGKVISKWPLRANMHGMTGEQKEPCLRTVWTVCILLIYDCAYSNISSRTNCIWWNCVTIGQPPPHYAYRLLVSDILPSPRRIRVHRHIATYPTLYVCMLYLL